MSETTVRPTKKQQELLVYIGAFIEEHGYSPSYREIMAGLSYNSVATVALHVNSLIRRGHLRKRDHSARSLEVVTAEAAADQPATWLLDKITAQFAAVAAAPTEAGVADLQILVQSLAILGYVAAAEPYISQLEILRAGL